jgi:Barrel-sandwich domain of CusB or HlyD membrane-fusion
VVADLSKVWVVGEVYERDLAHVREGAEAEVAASALPGAVLHGRISYIDPRLDPVARTAKVRVEIANPRKELRFGMYVTMRLSVGGGGPVAVVPCSAVQPVGEVSVVYLPAAEGEGRFVERPVTLGSVVGDAVQVVKGLKPGDRVDGEELLPPSRGGAAALGRLDSAVGTAHRPTPCGSHCGSSPEDGGLRGGRHDLRHLTGGGQASPGTAQGRERGGCEPPGHGGTGDVRPGTDRRGGPHRSGQSSGVPRHPQERGSALREKAGLVRAARGGSQLDTWRRDGHR